MLDREGLYTDVSSSIGTFTGKKMNPLNAKVEDIDVYDIAHALARSCRYNGHVGHFLSVARHSVWVADYLHEQHYGPRLELWGLLHDASETYLGDMVKPLKYQDTMDLFREAENRLDAVIARKFGLAFPMPAEVHEADRVVTVDREIGGGLRWSHESTYEEDEDAFLARFDLLTLRINESAAMLDWSAS